MSRARTTKSPPSPRRGSVLLVAQTQAIFHGAAYMGRLFADALRESNAVTLILVEKDAARDPSKIGRLEVGRFTPRKALVALRVLTKVAFVALRKRPTALIFLPSQRTSAVYLDALLTFVGRVFGIGTHLYLHGIGWREAASSKTLKGRLVSYTFREAASCIYLSQSLLYDTPSTFAGRTHLLPNAIDVEQYPQRSTPPGAGTVQLLYLSTIVPEKGIYDCLRALAALRDAGVPVHLEAAGHFRSDLERSQILHFADSLGLLSHLSFPGFLDGEEKLAAFHKADFFLLPSRAEAFPIVLLEALATGTPCFAYDVGGISDLLSAAEGSLVTDVGNWRAALSWVHRLSADPDAYRHASLSARRVAEQHSLLQFRHAAIALASCLTASNDRV